jgi:hypothetical protein
MPEYWRYDAESRSVVSVNANGKIVTPHPHRGEVGSEVDAAGYLIAAAPDLLAACEALCEAVAGQSALLAIEGALVVEYREALAAIAKARGER